MLQGDIDIGVDSFLMVDNTETVDLLGQASDDHGTKPVNKPNCLSDVQYSHSDSTAVTDSPLNLGASYRIDISDKPVDEMTKPREDISQIPAAIGDVNTDIPHTADGEHDAVAVTVDPMVSIDAECENMVITSIADGKNVSISSTYFTTFKS